MTGDPHPIDYRARYHALGRLALAAAAGESASALLDAAVAEAVALVGLAAGAVRLYGPEGTETAHAFSGDPASQERLNELESTLLAQLRRNYAVKSLYMTLDLDGPAGLFSYPLKSGDTILGSISGVSRGERSLAREEEFVAALAAMIVLIGRASGAWPVSAGTPVADEAAVRSRAVRETAAAINHEVNNPLMAVMGNVELLLRKEQQFDPDARDKLHKIHEAAGRIRQVTQDLMRISDPRSTPYPGGSSMIDIDGSPKSDRDRA